MTFSEAAYSDCREETMKSKAETEIKCSARCEAVAQGPEIPTDNSSVSALVTKSKKAAASLFTLLHAKVGHILTLHQIHRIIQLIESIFVLLELQTWCSSMSSSWLC